MRALIVGAGSVGGYFGGHLAAAQRDVSFLVRPHRATQLVRGLTISSHGRDTVIPVKLLAYGEWNGARSERIAELDAFMRGAGFDARLSTEIEREMWEKWAMLSSLGAITCLMDGDIGRVSRATGGTAFVQALFAEVVATIDRRCLAAARRAFQVSGSHAPHGQDLDAHLIDVSRHEGGHPRRGGSDRRQM